MEQFIRRKNVERFRLILAEIVADETERQRILKQLAEERQKQQIAAENFTEAE
jgi:hypothetical protein